MNYLTLRYLKPRKCPKYGMKRKIIITPIQQFFLNDHEMDRYPKKFITTNMLITFHLDCIPVRCSTHHLSQTLTTPSVINAG